MKICKNSDFWHISGIFGRKSGKTNDEITRKCRKTGFSGTFLAFSAGNEFFPEIGLHHILGIAILHLCAKKSAKLTSQSREKLVTNGRTDKRTKVNL